jgi:predicted CoA-binding protein
MIVGASNNRAKFGNKAVRAYVRQGHDVIPVNPHEQTIEGVRCFPSVRHVLASSDGVDRAMFYVPPEVGLTIIGDLASRDDVKELWLNPGAESAELIAAAQRLGFEPVLACAIVDIGERPG